MLDRPHTADYNDRFRVPAHRVNGLYELGFSRSEVYGIVAPRRTRDRRIKNGELLSTAESDRVQRLEKIMAFALRVFGDPDKVNRWMRKPNRALDQALPVELLRSEAGADIVEGELHAIDHGMYV